MIDPRNPKLLTDPDEIWLAAQPPPEGVTRAPATDGEPLPWNIPIRYVLTVTQHLCTNCGRNSRASRISQYLPRPEGDNVFRYEPVPPGTTLYDVEIVQQTDSQVTHACVDCIDSMRKLPRPSVSFKPSFLKDTKLEAKTTQPKRKLTIDDL